MAFGIIGTHASDQRFTVEEIEPDAFAVAVRQGGDEIVLLKLRDPSWANADRLAAALTEAVGAVITPAVIQGMIDGAGEDSP